MKTLVLVLLALSLGCAKTSKNAGEKSPVTARAAELELGAKACFLLYNMKTGTFEEVVGEVNCREQLPASSTFKVPLAVMAFDSGVLKDENVVLKWDGKKDIREELNRDHNAKTWMRDSVVWFSQRLTPEIGQKKLQQYLQDFNYGNQDLSGGLTQAWLVSAGAKSGALKISGYEQLEFMKRLWTDRLPAVKRAMRLTREITFLQTSPGGYRLNGKTGSNYYDKERRYRLGWFVAHIEGHGKEYLAVTVFSDTKPTTEKKYGGPRAKEMTINLLNLKGLW